MSEEIKHDRRSFRRAGAMSIATASLGIYGYCDAPGDGCSGSITLFEVHLKIFDYQERTYQCRQLYSIESIAKQLEPRDPMRLSWGRKGWKPWGGIPSIRPRPRSLVDWRHENLRRTRPRESLALSPTVR